MKDFVYHTPTKVIFGKGKHKDVGAIIKEYGYSRGQLDRLRKNQNVSTYTLDQLCKILDCELSDIAEYKKDTEEK